MKSQITEHATIEKIIPGGQGIATLENGKKALIWGALPGEEINFEVTKNKKSYCEGYITDIIQNTSPHRVDARDECFLSTSPWQIMDYSYELDQKRELVIECLRQNNINTDVLPTITDDKDYFYRNKMEYALYWDNNEEKIYPAFRRRGSHQKIPITQSSIERKEIFSEVQNIIQNLNDHHAEARKYQSIMIRCNQKGEVSTALFENGKPHPKMQNLTDIILERKYSYSPNGFFQINLPVYELVLQEIKKHITTQNILDLYAGVGSIGLSISSEEQNLILVESNKDAFQELEQNCNKSSARAILDKSENVPNYIQPEQTVILDPPRAGCDRKLINELNKTTPESIIYLSCNPITQARDLSILLENYNLEKIQPYNFFPHTPHIECLAILKRK